MRLPPVHPELFCPRVAASVPEMWAAFPNARRSPGCARPLWLAGLFGYLLHRSAAKAFLADSTVFPLDVVFNRRAWGSNSRFELARRQCFSHHRTPKAALATQMSRRWVTQT